MSAALRPGIAPPPSAAVRLSPAHGPRLRLVDDQVAVADVLEDNVVPGAGPVDLLVPDLHRRDVLDEVGGVTANVDLVAQGERRAQADCGNRAMAEVMGHLAQEWCPAVLPYLSLPPGFRFLIAPDYEDVWEDAALLEGESP